MAITILLRYFSCGLILYCLDAKSISLNDLIAAEKLDLHPHQELSNIPEQLSFPKLLPLLEVPTETKAKKRGEPSNINSGQKRSLLRFRKTFPIKSASKPKKLKLLQKPDSKRNKLTTKREVQRRHVKINQKYIPLLRNIELLFDNILSSDSSETYESRNDKYKRNQITNKKDNTCTCSGKNDSEESSYTQDERNTSTSSPSNEIENASTVITTTAQTDNIVYDNISRFGRNKNIPILFARNPTSIRGNGTRFSERSSPTYIRGSEGHIPGDNGHSKRNAVIGVDASYSENNGKNSNSNSRNSAGFRFTGGTRGIGTSTQTPEAIRGAIKSTTLEPNETFKDDSRNISEHKEQTDFQVRGVETKSPVFLSKLAPGLRDSDSQEENFPIRSTEDNEKSIPSDISNDKRIIVRNGQIPAENKKVRRTNEAVGPKVVMIFDGYSVARDVNGENKMTEKAIHIHS